MTEPPDRDQHLDGSAEDVEAVMRAARAISAIIAGSVAQTDDAVTLPQLRALILVASRPDVSSSEVATSLRVHPSNASRLCERLVQAGFLDRSDDPQDRRHVVLRLTASGTELVRSVMDYRRRAFRTIVESMSAEGRSHLRTGLEEFATLAPEPGEGWEFTL